MTEKELLGFVEDLFKAAQHPEITDVGPIVGDDHSPAGVKVAFEDGAKGILVVYPQGGWPKQAAPVTQAGGKR